MSFLFSQKETLLFYSPRRLYIAKLYHEIDFVGVIDSNEKPPFRLSSLTVGKKMKGKRERRENTERREMKRSKVKKKTKENV